MDKEYYDHQPDGSLLPIGPEERGSKEMTFTSLAELKGFLNGLCDSDLHAITNTHDWYVIDLQTGFNKHRYFSITGYDDG